MIETRKTVAAENVKAKGIAWRSATPQEPIGYCFDARLMPDETGGYTAYVAQLRGIVSEGDDAESAIKNIIEAFQVAIETYLEEGMPIPWSEARPRQSDELSFRVAVNV